MADLFRSYVALIRTSWETALEYRAQILLWFLTFFFPLIMMAVWLTLVDEAGPAAGWDQAKFVSYYVGAALVNHLTTAWVLWDWDEEIRTGTLSVKLVKPLDPFHYYLSNQLGWKIFISLFMGIPIVIAAWLLPMVSYPLTPIRVAAFAASLAGGFGVNMAMAVCFAMIAFWSTQARNLYSLWVGVGQFLSGWIAPLALFPASIRQLAYWLPFRSSLGFPMEILLGDLGGSEIAFGFGVTIAWTALFVLIYRLLWQRGLRRYEAVGS